MRRYDATVQRHCRVLLAGPVGENHVVLAEFLKPASKLTLYVPEPGKPGQGVMIGSHVKSSPEQVMPELPSEGDNSQ